MSHAVVRGEASPSQLYLDDVLNLVLKDKNNKDKSKVSLGEVIFFCMKRKPQELFMINGSTGESFSNQYILQKSIPIANALLARGNKGKNVMLVLRNHQYMAAVYYGTIFSGSIPLLLDTNSSSHELQHFITLISPSIIFCESCRVADVMEVLNNIDDERPHIVAADDEADLEQFVAGFNDDVDNFRVTEVDLQLPAIMLPTSGSTGVPKAALLTHSGLVAQLPVLWINHKQFPKPTNTVMLLTTAQWMTHTIMMTTCPVYDITLLMTPLPSIENWLNMARIFKPTWTLISAPFVGSFASAASLDDLASLQTVLVTGSQPNEESMKAMKRKLSEAAHFGNSYGMTEAQSFVALSVPGTPFKSVGRIFNIFEYKLVDEEEKEVGDNQNGQLFIRSKYNIVQGYYKNEEAYKECVTADNWLQSGDVFYQNHNLLYFVERKKFWFFYLNNHISPEEVEAVIGRVPGVQECVVCETPAGAAAGVVKQPGSDVTERDIHHAVDSSLSDYKRLRGGIIFVTALPHTHSGKLHRANCRKEINRLLQNRG